MLSLILSHILFINLNFLYLIFNCFYFNLLFIKIATKEDRKLVNAKITAQSKRLKCRSTMSIPNVPSSHARDTHNKLICVPL